VVTRRLPSRVEDALAERFDVVTSQEDQALDAGGLQRALADADGVLCTVTDRFTAEVLAGYPIRARIIANFGVGTDNIDLAAAAAHDILVTNTPDVLTDDTADLAMTLILMTMRRAGEGERQLRGGRWTGWRPTHLIGRRVTGSTLGIVGLGRIGRAVAHRARHGFGMRVLGWSRTMPDDGTLAELGVEPMPSLEALLSASDIVSLHLPGTPETARLIDARALSLMPPGSFLVNTARGTVVDTNALIDSMVAGHLAGAGLDVYPREPEVDRRLLGMEQVTLLPHLGSATREGREAMGFRALMNLEACFDGRTPPDVVGRV
jgi:glyoxylate reductase